MRKGHGSTKVPGVKLRPPPKTLAARSVDTAADDDHDSVSTGTTSQLNSSGPFVGVVVCATGVTNKSQLFNQAKQLGAASSTHFTNLTTHLVAEEAGSAKYLCALERGIPIMSPEWVRESHAIWVSGGEVDFEESVAKHRLPVFLNVKLCLTGFEDVQERLRLHQLVAKNGGVYSKGFEPSVTHLLVCGDSAESIKTQTALKLNKTRARENQIHVIWEDWLWDSIEYQGMWDPAQYSFENPRPQRKPPKPTTPSVDDAPKRTVAPLPPSIKNDLLISAQDPSEQARTRHIPGISSHMWQSILRARGGVDKIRASLQQQSTDEQPASKGAVISRVSSAKAAALQSSSAARPTTTTARQPFSRVASAAVPGSSRQLAPLRATASLVASLPSTSSESQHRTFLGKSFFALGSANCDALAAAVQDNGGVWATSDESVDFVLVRLTESALFWAEYDDNDGRGRTECWMEKCLYDERIVGAEEHLTFAPLRNPGPLPDADKLSICFSGLGSAEGCWIKRLLRAIGANYLPAFSRKCTHLICDSGEGQKCERAREWDIPVVGTVWLFDLAAGDNVPTQRTGSQPAPAMVDITNAGASAGFSSLTFDAPSETHFFDDAPTPAASLGRPSLLIPNAASSKDAVDTPVVPSSCTPSPMKFASPHPGGESVTATIITTGKRTRSDDRDSEARSQSVKKARPGSRSRIALERGSSVVSMRSESAPATASTGGEDVAMLNGTQEESMVVRYMDTEGEVHRSALLRAISAPEEVVPSTKKAKSKKEVATSGRAVHVAADGGRRQSRRMAGF